METPLVPGCDCNGPESMINDHCCKIGDGTSVCCNIAGQKVAKDCLQDLGLAPSVVKALSKEMTCATKDVNLATTNVHVTYGQGGTETLSDESKNGLGMYEYIGIMKSD